MTPFPQKVKSYKLNRISRCEQLTKNNGTPHSPLISSVSLWRKNSLNTHLGLVDQDSASVMQEKHSKEPTIISFRGLGIKTLAV